MASCRNCGWSKVTRPRGLCYSCYYSPGVRDRYPSISKFAGHGHKDFNGAGRVPDPTLHLPGSPDKISVLESRAADGFTIFHPDDGKVGDKIRPAILLMNRRNVDKVPYFNNQLPKVYRRILLS